MRAINIIRIALFIYLLNFILILQIDLQTSLYNNYDAKIILFFKYKLVLLIFL